MIHELASFESATSSATTQSLLDTLSFAEHPGAPATTSGYAKTLLIYHPQSRDPQHSTTTDDESSNNPSTHTHSIAGMAMYFNNYSTWDSAPGIYLEDLFVRPAYRKRGYGKLLIQGLARECKRIGGTRVEWSCLKWNHKALGFYASLGAEEMVEWTKLRLEGAGLNAMAEEAPESAVLGEL